MVEQCLGHVTRLLLVMGVTVTVADSTAGLDRITVHPTHNWFLDSYGRVRIFHGVNAVTKHFPWYPEYFLEDTRMEDFKRMGLNFVRLGTMWSGLEPTEGHYNATYLHITEDIVRRLGEHGIYTMLDMHQDVMTTRDGIAHYDGLPRWLVDKFPPSPKPYPWPLEEVTQWEEAYLTQTASFWFQLWYNNYHGTAYKWVDFWAYLAQHFTGRTEVIGYNLINEPWVGNYIEDPSLLLPGNAGRRNLAPLYDLINTRIRRHDKEGIIFYEPVFHGQALDGDATGSGFDHVPGGAQFRNVSAYSFHMYCWALEFMPPGADDDARQQAVELCNDRLLPLMMNSQQSNVRRTGGASLLTEFGICRTYQDRVDVDCNTFMDLSDRYLIGWVDWDHSDHLWYRDGQLHAEKVSDYVRAYARAIAGEPQQMTYDRKSHHFRLVYEAEPHLGAPTEIFVPDMHYPNGYDVAIEGTDVTYEKNMADSLLLVSFAGDSRRRLDVKVTPK